MAPASATRESVCRQPAGLEGTAHEGPLRPEGSVLPESEQRFTWFGAAETPRLVARRSWLVASGVPVGSTEVTGERFPEVLRPILDALLDLYPWALRRRTHANLPQLRLRLSASSWDRPGDEITFTLERSVFLTVGLPPEDTVQAFPSQRGVEVYADLAHVYPPDAAGDAAAAEGASLRAHARGAREGCPGRGQPGHAI